MSTYEQTHPTSPTPSFLFSILRSWRPVFLAALIPLAAACTDTVTGLEELDHQEESTVDDRPPESERPVAL